MAVTISQILDKMDKMPEPPKASVQAVNMLEDPNVPIAKVAEFITTDECLTSKLLKLSNSAHYGYSGRVNTAREALMRIGTNIVKCSLYSAMLETAGFVPNPLFIELWKSALFSAFVARNMGERLGYAKPDICFTAGLICDIGQLMMNEFSTQVYTNLAREVRKGGYDLLQVENQVYGFTHIHVGYKMAELWKLPVMYQNVIRFHHDPVESYKRVLPDDYKVILAVHVANNLSPVFSDMKGRGIKMEALEMAGIKLSRETIVDTLAVQFPSYYRDIAAITKSMFGNVG